jgi:hypothetical protein
MHCNHGRICVIVRRNVQASVVNLASYKTIELMALRVSTGTSMFLLVIIHRPVLLAASDYFFDEFADVLELMSSYARYITVGDLNVHLDGAECDSAIKLQFLLESFGLHDLVGGQTIHVRGHQLDVVITRQDQSVAFVHVDPPSLLSDHSLIVVTRDVVCTSSQSSHRTARRRWRSFDIEALSADLRQSRMVADPPSNVTTFFDYYDNTLRSLLDKCAPLCEATIRLNRSAPWYDVDCRRFKAQTR